MLSRVQSGQASQPLPLLAAQHGGAVGVGFSEEVAAVCGDEGREVRRTRAQAPSVEDDDGHALMRRPHDEAAAADAVKHGDKTKFCSTHRLYEPRRVRRGDCALTP